MCCCVGLLNCPEWARSWRRPWRRSSRAIIQPLMNKGLNTEAALFGRHIVESGATHTSKHICLLWLGHLLVTPLAKTPTPTSAITWRSQSNKITWWGNGTITNTQNGVRLSINRLKLVCVMPDAYPSLYPTSRQSQSEFSIVGPSSRPLHFLAPQFSANHHNEKKKIFVHCDLYDSEYGSSSIIIRNN